MNEAEQKLVHRDGNPDCPACSSGRVHTSDDWKEFHPYAGHGYTPEVGWTHKDLVPAPKSKATVVAL